MATPTCCKLRGPRLCMVALRTALLVALAPPGSRAFGQFARPEGLTATFRLDVFGTTRHQWRGIRRNVHPVTQVTIVGAAIVQGVSLSAGAWGNFELGSTAQEVRPDLRVGGAGASQWSGWGQLGYRTGQLTAAAGVLRDWYVRPGVDPKVTEAYTTIRLQQGRWAPAVSAWQALEGAEGTYVEPSITFYHFANPFTGLGISWATALRGGFQLWQRRPDAGPTVPGPSGSGLTHIGVGSTVRVLFNVKSQLALLAATGPELQFSRDAAAKRGRDGEPGAGLQFWWPLQVGLSWPLRRPE